MTEITAEHLEMQIERAASCATYTLPARQLMPLLNLAIRANTDAFSTLNEIRQAAGDVEVQLTGDEMRMILDLALQTKLSMRKPRPRLKHVRSAKRS